MIHAEFGNGLEYDLGQGGAVCAGETVALHAASHALSVGVQRWN